MNEETNPNMRLWDSWGPTDPKATKRFTRKGGFAGTAVKPFWLVKRMTEAFGPCGIGWGVSIIREHYTEHCVFVTVEVWYMDYRGGIDCVGRIQQIGGTDLYVERDEYVDGKKTGKKIPVCDDEAAKKAVTDGMAKCFSMLGLGGDIHMGLFDDSKYVHEAAEAWKGKEEPPAARQEAPKNGTTQKPAGISDAYAAFQRRLQETMEKDAAYYRQWEIRSADGTKVIKPAWLASIHWLAGTHAKGRITIPQLQSELSEDRLAKAYDAVIAETIKRIEQSVEVTA